MAVVRSIVFENCPNTPQVDSCGKLILQNVWLFESGKFYEGAASIKIYPSKDAAVSNVPDSFILDPDNYKPVFPSPHRENYYEDSKSKMWIRISERQVEKE